MFEAYGTAHIITLAISATLLFVFILVARRNQQHGTYIGRGLGAMLLLNYVVYVIYRIDGGYWDIRFDLPMELCNWSAFVTAITAFTRKQIWFELSYFWVMAGSIQGVITPDLQVTFPHIYFFIFFIAHNGLVLTALFFAAGWQMRPRPGAIWRVLLLSQIFFVAALLISWLVEGNYGYMMRKPKAASLLDYLGPWPWYLVSLQGVALVMYSVLYFPFWFLNRKESL